MTRCVLLSTSLLPATQGRIETGSRIGRRRAAGAALGGRLGPRSAQWRQAAGRRAGRRGGPLSGRVEPLAVGFVLRCIDLRRGRARDRGRQHLPVGGAVGAVDLDLRIPRPASKIRSRAAWSQMAASGSGSSLGLRAPHAEWRRGTAVQRRRQNTTPSHLGHRRLDAPVQRVHSRDRFTDRWLMSVLTEELQTEDGYRDSQVTVAVAAAPAGATQPTGGDPPARRQILTENSHPSHNSDTLAGDTPTTLSRPIRQWPASVQTRAIGHPSSSISPPAPDLHPEPPTLKSGRIWWARLDGRQHHLRGAVQPVALGSMTTRPPSSTSTHRRWRSSSAMPTSGVASAT